MFYASYTSSLGTTQWKQSSIAPFVEFPDKWLSRAPSTFGDSSFLPENHNFPHLI